MIAPEVHVFGGQIHTLHTLHTLHKGRGFWRVENSYPYPPKTLEVWATLVIH